MTNTAPCRQGALVPKAGARHGPDFWRATFTPATGSHEGEQFLHDRPNILIFDEPTQGIDVGARAEIYGLLEKLRADGKSIILISSETEEIQGTCDRTIVMRSGHVTGELNAEEMKDTKLMLQYMYKDV